MADITYTTANSAGFIPQFWAQRALDVLRANIVLARLVAKDSSLKPGDFATQGSTLTIPYPGTFTAVDKAASTPVTPQAPSGGNSVTLTLSKHKVVPFLIEDFANAQANMELMDRYMNPAVIAIAETLESDLFGLYTGFNTAIGASGTAITGSVIRTARSTMNKQRNPVANRSLIVSPDDEIAILGDTTLQTFFAFAQSQGVKEGSIGRIYGFDVYQSQLVPVTGDIYTMTAGGTPSAGSWVFGWNGFKATIPWNATGAAMQTLIQAAVPAPYGAAITVGTVSAGGPYVVTFATPAADVGVAPTADVTLLTGGTAFTIAKTAGAVNKNLAIGEQSILLATRPFRDPPADAGVMTGTAVDPASGLSIRVSAQYDINNMGVRCNVDILYGFTNLRPEVGCVVQS